jgi:hypothetical protein
MELFCCKKVSNHVKVSLNGARRRQGNTIQRPSKRPVGRSSLEEQSGGREVVEIISAVVPTQLAPDLFRHRWRTVAKLTLSLMHVGADLLLGGLQTGYHAHSLVEDG